MTEQNCNYTGRYFLFLLKKLRTCIIFAVIFSLGSFPAMAITNGSKLQPVISAALSVCEVISIAGLCILSFATPLIAMKHLYTKTTADNILSLPVTTRQRYFCEFGAALGSYAVPFLLINLPVCIAEGFAANGFPMLFLACLVMFSVFNIFLTCFCGRLAETALYPIALNIIIPLSAYFIVLLSRAKVYGAVEYANYSSATAVIFGSTSPIGCFLYFSMINPYNWYNCLIPTAIFILLFGALGYIVYSKRPAQNIGQPFVFNRAYAVNSILVSVLCVILYISAVTTDSNGGNMIEINSASFIILAVMLLLLMLIMELINYKKIKSIVKFLLKYAAVLAGGFFISYALYISEGFGESGYVPSANDAAYITVSVDIVKSGSSARFPDPKNSVNDSISLTVESDSGMAEYIRGIHRGILSEHPEDGSALFQLQYYLKNGNHIYRYYYCTLPSDFSETITSSEEYRLDPITTIDCREFELKNQFNGELEVYIYPQGPAPTALKVIDPITRDTLGTYDGIDWKTLREALYEDLKNDIYFGRHLGDAPECIINLGKIEEAEKQDPEKGYIKSEDFISSLYNGISLYNNYTNTLNCLAQLGSKPSFEKVSESFLKNNDGIMSVCRIMTEGTAQSVRVISPMFRSMWSASVVETVFITPEEFIEALKYGANYIRDDGHGYICLARTGLANSMHNKEAIEYLYQQGYLDLSDIEEYGQGAWYSLGWGTDTMINEQYYPMIDKYFSDGRPVFTYDPAAEDEQEER